MKMYQVGGCVRDRFMGDDNPKDIDYTVVLEPSDFPAEGTAISVSPYNIMVRNLENMGYKAFRNKKTDEIVGHEFFTMRGIGPDHKAADFVLARKERGYGDGRRPSEVKVGTLYDDLERRDFTMNAIAMDMDGNYIDPFGGEQDIADGVIRAVGDPFDRMTEDALRAVRALRFSVMKGMRIDPGLAFAMESVAVRHAIENKISDERIDEELRRMFAFSTMESLAALYKFPMLTAAMFSGSVSLTSTMKGNVPAPPKFPEGRNGCSCMCHTTGAKHISRCC